MIYRNLSSLQRVSQITSYNIKFRRHSSRLYATAIDKTGNKNPGPLPIVIETKGVPVHLYAPADEVESQALRQLITLAETPLPVVEVAGQSMLHSRVQVGYVAAMPDVHLGKGVTIGTVFASDRYICPNAVGVDIGCGMCAVPLKGLHKDQLTKKQLVQIQQFIKNHIPTGFNSHVIALRHANQALDDISHNHAPSAWLLNALSDSRVTKQIGTLGGGNHFLEVVYDESGQVWAMLHSGSRHIGNKTAQHYDELAKKMLSKQNKTAPPGLNYMPIESDAGQAYLKDMEWCQAYAFENRQSMLNIMIQGLHNITGASPEPRRTVNIHHNYCQCEQCTFKDPRTGTTVTKDLFVTRKGATSAQPGQLGLIPGNMATGSYIVQGRGNAESWSSCSHGAGRKMSRTQAKKSIPQREFVESMKGIVCDTDPRVKDEAPQAYKSLSTVMQNQASLVDVVHRLRVLVNVKGFEK